MPHRLRAEIRREIERLELVLAQIAAVERERDTLMAEAAAADRDAAPAALMRLRGIGSELASLIWLEGLFRRFGNRRQLAAYAGLAPSPWQSGGRSANKESPNPGTRDCGRP